MVVAVIMFLLLTYSLHCFVQNLVSKKVLHRFSSVVELCEPIESEDVHVIS